MENNFIIYIFLVAHKQCIIDCLINLSEFFYIYIQNSYQFPMMYSHMIKMLTMTRATELPTQAVRFWMFVIPTPFSIIFSLFTLYSLITDQTLRGALNNHVIIVLLIIGLLYELTSVPWLLYNDHNHKPLSESYIFIRIWLFLSYPLCVMQSNLFAWATIERHILIFHDQWLSTARKRFLIHYLPIGVIIIYCLIYFSIIFFAPLCDDTDGVDNFLVGGLHVPCSFAHTVLGLWDISFHQLTSILIIVSFSIGLIVHSIWRRNRLRQGVNWRKYRKMIIQLLKISTIYFIFNAPWVIIVFAYQFGLPDSIALPLLLYTGFFAYYIIFLFPFVCCLSMVELREKLIKILKCGQAPRIVPRGFTTAQIAVTTITGRTRRNISIK